MNPSLRSSLLLLSLALAPLLRAQPQDLRFERITIDQGLPSNGILEVIQDHEGFLWMIDVEGLLIRYDGYSFTSFVPDRDDPYRPSGIVNALYVDRTGTLWIGTKAGLDRLDRRTGQFVRYRNEPGRPGSLSHDEVSSLTGDQEGTIWVGTSGGGLNRLDPTSGAFSPFRHDPSNSRSLPSDTVTSLLAGAAGILWIGTTRGLRRLDAAIGAFHPPPGSSPASRRFSAVAIGEMYESPSEAGVLWLTTEGGWAGLLHRFDTRTGSVTPFVHDPGDPGRLIFSTVGAVLEDRRGSVWIGMRYGTLERYDRTTGTFTHYAHDPDDPYSLNRNWLVFDLLEDRNGVLWIATGGGGLNKLDPQAHRFGLMRHIPGEDQSLAANDVQAIFEDEEGLLWIGMEGGLDRYDPKTQRFTHYRHDPRDPSSLADEDVSAVYRDREGIVWVGTYRGSLNRLDPRTGQVVRYLHDPDDSGSLGGVRVLAVREDREGLFWVGTEGSGLQRMDRATGRFRTYDLNPQSPYEIVHVIQEDPGGDLWVTSGTVLFRYDREADRFAKVTEVQVRTPHAIRSLCIDRKGRIWIGATSLTLFDPRTGRSDSFTPLEEMPVLIAGIHEEARGHLWLSTGKGLFRFDPENRTFRTYDVSDGLQGVSFNDGSFKGRDGRLYFGGMNGLNAFDPSEIEDDTIPPQVALTDFRLFNEPVGISENGPLRSHISVTDEIELAHWQNDLSFDFVGLHLRRPEKIRYAYRLEGYDDDWRDIGGQRTVTFTNLDPGTYTFHVKAANPDGVWNEEGARVRVIVLPPWWRTWWAYGLYALAFAAGVFAVDRFQRRRLIRRERERSFLREKELRTEAAEAWANYLQADNERKTQELEQARALQLSLLPKVLPEHSGVRLAAHMQTATEVGGDYYDVDLAGDGTLTLVIGDATGHGARAGTVVTAMKSLWNAFAREADLETVLRRSSEALRQMHLPKLYMALALARLRGRTVEFAGAGMPPALLYRAATGTVEAVPLKGTPLGSPGTFPYSKACRTLAPGDTLVFMSDGFPELRDASGEQLGYERMPDVFAEVADRSPEAIVAHLTAAARSWSNGRPPDDDMTFVVVKVREDAA